MGQIAPKQAALSWEAWVRLLTGLTPTAQLVAFEIARLADTRGVAIVSINHLIATTARSRRGILEAMLSLEKRGLLRREKRRDPQARFQTNRVQLIRGASTSTASTAQKPLSRADQLDGKATATNDSLRNLLQAAKNSQWRGQASADLAATIAEFGPRKFGSIITKRRIRGCVQDPWETLTLAWEVAQKQTESLISAREPWGLWVHLVDRASWQEDEQDTLSTEGATADSASPPVLGIDDFDLRMKRIVGTLIDAGMSESIAWAGTARLLELMDAGNSRRHWLAGRDSKLQGLGVDANTARAWMTLLVGSRRGKKGILNNATEPDIQHQAQVLCQASLI